MPKKTKKEKLLTDYRKRIKLISSHSPPRPAVAADNIFDSHIYFRQDLRKSLILIVGIITLEIALYFARIIK